MTDLKLIDELLVDLKGVPGTWGDMDRRAGTVVREAINRLRQAWRSGEMPEITLSLCRYFENGDDVNAYP